METRCSGFLVRAGIQADEQRVSRKKHHDLYEAITQKLQCSFGQPVSHQNFLEKSHIWGCWI